MKYMIIVFLLCLCISCEKDKDLNSNGPENIPLEYEEILKNLNEAYDMDSREKLYQVLEYWHNENKSIKPGSLGNDTVRNVYDVYKEFYSPFNIARIGGSEWGNEIYADVSYAVIQNRLQYDFAYESLSVAVPDTVADFRPELNFDNGVKALYLTENYARALTVFLGSEYNPLGTGGIMNPAGAAGDSYERQQFLGNYIKVIYGHWGGYWHLETHPEVYRISFDENMNNAQVHFRLVYEGGEADLTRQNGKWKLVSSGLTWIE